MNQVTASITDQSYKTEVDTNDFKFIVDEPKSLGGTEQGPNPGNLLAAALASCTAITLRMYANRKDWPVDSIDVTVDFERNQERQTTEFRREINIKGTLDEKQKSRLLAIANACPVHKTLSSASVINTIID